MIGTQFCSKFEKGYAFTLADIVNNRLHIGDEMDVNLEVWGETLKLLTSGIPVRAEEKFKRSALIMKTFFIILSNYDDIFPIDDPFWNYRIVLKHLKPYPWLQDEVDGMIHPIAWKKIFQHFDFIAQSDE